MKTVEVSYSHQGSEYVVHIEVDSPEFFAKAAPQVEGKTGEALISALKTLSKGNITEISRRKDGRLSDSPDGEAAIESFSLGRTAYSKSHYSNGLLSDVKGEPAIQEFNARGLLIEAQRFTAGTLNDGAAGEPAIQRFDDSGEETYRAHITQGKLVQELFGGEPVSAAPATWESVLAAFGNRLRIAI